MIRRLFCLAILFFPALSRSQTYPQNYFGNPIDTPFYLAGTFGEIRNDHFHTGIDFSTRKEEGKPVYAAADGYVSRIKVSSVGFGKAVYITHPNGYVTVYGHLKKFAEPIEKFTKKSQYKSESFEIDLPVSMNQIKIKKGSVIAWSGNSGGSSGPHLHFEIRDERTEEPINPFLFGYAVADTIPPLIKAVRLYPGPGQGVIGDSDRPKTFEVVQTSKGYQLATSEYIQLLGRIGFEFSINDLHTTNGNSLGIYSMTLVVDSQQVFSMKYDRLNFSDTRYVNAHIDYAAKYDDEGIFERCFRLTGDKLKLYGDTGITGYFDFIEDGGHVVYFEVKDFNGNSSKLNFQVLSYSTLSEGINQTQPEEFFAMFPDKGLAIHKSDVEIVIPANSIYETLLFTNSQSLPRAGFYSNTYEIGDVRVPLHLAITVSLKPRQLPDHLKSKAVVALFDKYYKPVYMGSEWNGEFLSAKSKRFGTFAISVDTIAPVAILVSLPSDSNSDDQKLKVKITDDFSGIKTYRALLDGNWHLMEYDAKKNLLFCDIQDISKNKQHLLELTISDFVGNTTTIKKEFQY